MGLKFSISPSTRPARAPLSPVGVGPLLSGSYEFGGLSCSRSSGSGEPGRARQLGRPASEESEETGGPQQSVSSRISGTDFVALIAVRKDNDQ
jgi:hypothetical protein